MLLGVAQQQINNSGVAPGGDLWTAAQLTPASWHDASDAGSITDTAGATSQWRDVSGNVRHLNGVGVLQPTTGTVTQNGLNTLAFASSMMSLDTSGSGKYSIFAVLKTNVIINNSAAAASIIRHSGSNNSGFKTGSSTSTVVNEVVTMHGAASIRSAITSDTLASIAVGVHVFSFVLTTEWFMGVDGSTDLFFVNANGVEPVFFGIGSTIGARDNSSEFFNGSFCELVTFDTALSESDRLKMEGSLSHKWGGTLASGHIYEGAAPTI